ncbi:TetR/AcrR family transcriptional regulator [Foetidibacter luteolus]|uniref:TetR/AcrR family transcriptional regulator n=1 Tax=Foetidibacter luteolus TaxID=2608880 RepID=UPI00129B8900|nr:TetR/AcrR family transcriptional regulator [Foetidibacter luteolus]
MRLKDDNKKERIRNKAIEMIVHHGFDGLSMQKLAKAAGVSPATIYIHYKDRDDLIVTISLEIANRLFESSLLNFSPDMNFEEGMRLQWKNRANFFIAHPMDMLFIEQVRYSPVYEKVREMLGQNFKEIMGRFVNKAIANSQLVPLPFEVYWSVAFAPLYQLIKFHTQGKSYTGKNFTLDEAMMEQTLQLVLKALKP